MIHPTAEISDKASIGVFTKIWNHVKIMRGAIIGDNCILGKGVFIDSNVKIGNKVKIQNNASIYEGVILEDEVFIGPHVCFTNDKWPRSTNKDGTLKGKGDWMITPTLVKRRASIGANSTIICGVTIGENAMVGAGSVVTKSVPDNTLVIGNPAKVFMNSLDKVEE